MLALFHGALLAIGLILPLGVQNVFVFNQGATQRSFLYALPAVITASLCDTLLISLAISGVSLLIFQILWLKPIVLLIGSFFLLYMGWTIWRTTTSTKTEKKTPLSIKEQIGFALSVSLLNPHAILDTIGVIGTSSIVYEGTEKFLFTIGCIFISWIWFFTLALTGRALGKLDTSTKLLKRINYLSAIIIWVIAFTLFYQLIREAIL
ncbi:LysE/ArgO family amino acid transporter [Bacillus suaedaesalsae]|uniref:Amino acid transporter n=1 Tax=Bacillus suaedaesalsae TaxID=2810349 RepID=A0ABS2DFY1_9BACI|nr:LysE/ArgO family amino acid transporter [Bacillus suaedaesalsae]MBM6617391.1 amino acid transporter [Bacillus suaedaesalsae]